MSRLIDRRNAKRVNGLRRDPRTGAGKLAKSERGYGGVLAFDFTDNSVALYDPTTQANVAYTQGVTDGNGNFRGPHALLTYTSPSNKLTMQSDGYIKYQAQNITVQGSESYGSYSATCTVTAGQTPPSGVADAVKLDFGALNQFWGVNQSGLVAGATYALTIYLRGDSAGTIQLQNVSSGSFSQEVSITTEWALYTVEWTETGTSGVVGLRYISGNTLTTVYAARYHLRRTPSNSEYIKQTGTSPKYALPIEYDTSGNCLGLLVEEARTNLCLYSGQFDNAAWTKSNVTVTANNTTAPNGLAHAELFADDATASFHRAIQTITVSSGTAYTASVYVKNNTAGFVGLRIYGNTNSDHIATEFNLSTGAVDGSGASAGATFTSITQTITDIGNGWYRITKGFTSTNTSIDVQLVACNASGQISGTTTLPSYSGTGTSVYVWGAQVEAGSFPTSPIITYGAAATRAADNISIATSAFPYATNGSTWFVEVDDYDGGSNSRLLSVYGTNRLLDIYRASSTTLAWFSNNTNLGFTSFSTSFDTEASNVNKIAVRLANNDSANYYNGSQISNDTSCTIDAIATTVGFGQYSGSSFGSFKMRKLYFVPRGKTAIELQAETA